IESWAVNEELWQKWRLIFTDLENPQRILDAQKFFTRHELTLLEGTAVLWPEKESYLQLMEQMVTMGRPAFFKEKQNIPPSAEGSIFCPETWHRFVLTKDGPLVAAPVGSDHIPISASAQHVSIFSQNDTVCDAAGHSGATPLPNDGGVTIETGHQLSYGRYHATPLSPGLAQLSVVGYLDPSLGRGDWAAIATVGKDPATGICYVLDVWVARVPPAAQVAKVFELHRRWRYQVFGYEAVGFQQILNETFAVENKKHCSEGKIMRQLDIRAVKSRKPKTLRIAGLEPLVASGWVRFAIGLPEELEAEARAFPSGRHDDALDALAGAVTLARSVGANQRIHTITVEPPRRQRPS
ncbi:MAG: hypothetical protein N2Z21_01700, partial [Candidatus Sumerlaeaceae bacterium]|nr:hypothetical protein [Candidatus Sumerlaeaceae bacterium]